jgi:hypothetical protein
MLYAAACFAAVDVNKATAAELDGIKGIGPGISTKILMNEKKATSRTGPTSLIGSRALAKAMPPNFQPKA